MFGFGFLYNKPTSSFLTAPLGLIYQGSDLSDWEVPETFTGTVDISQDGDTILMSGTGGTGGVNASNLFQDFILLNSTAHKHTCLPQWKITIDFETQSTPFDGNSFGYSCGVISVNDFEYRDTLCRFRQDTGGVGDLGRLYFYYTDTSAVGITNQEQPTGGYTPSTSTRYLQVFEKNYLDLTCTIYDSTGQLVRNMKTVSNSPPGGNLNRVHHNTGRFAIAQHGGTNRIHNIKIESDVLRNAPYGGMGNSHFYGGKASTLAGSMFHSAMSGLDYMVCAGWADRLVDMELRMPEIIALNPKILLVEGGSNDVDAGTFVSTGQNALDSIISQGQGASIDVRLMNAPARSDVDVTAVQTYMASLGLPVYDAFADTKQPSNTNLIVAYAAPDNIHLNDVGHPVCAAGIQTVMGI